MSLTLIEKIEINGINVYFYDGIDFDMIKDHNIENEFLIFFVENYVSEITKWERHRKLNSVLNGDSFEKFDNESHRNIAIYQTSGDLIPIYKSIKEKILDSDNHDFPYKIIGYSENK